MRKIFPSREEQQESEKTTVLRRLYVVDGHGRW
jgi:hypothetical protein